MKPTNGSSRVSSFEAIWDHTWSKLQLKILLTQGSLELSLMLMIGKKHQLCSWKRHDSFQLIAMVAT